MSAPPDEPAIPRRLRRTLAAAWISLGLHAALLALVQVAPPAAPDGQEAVIEARLVAKHAAPVVAAPPPVPATRRDEKEPVRTSLLPSELAEPLPVAAPAQRPTAAPAAAPVEPPAMPPPASAPAEAPAAAISSAVDLTYYSVRDLDVQPRALRTILPVYPDAADRQHLAGLVRVELKLESDGRIGDIRIVSASPPDVFEDATLEAFRNARFTPAQKNGRAVRARVLITIQYDPDARAGRQ